MKKLYFILIICFFVLFLLNCTKTQANKTGIIEIKDRLFLGQVNDIYMNSGDYLGRQIKMEGIFLSGEDTTGRLYYCVVRYGPGCCGDDGQVGFEVKWPESDRREYPKDGAWVEVTGELKKDRLWLFIEISSIIEMESNGREFVTQ